MNCPNCQNQVQPGTPTCPFCGTTLSAAPGAPQPGMPPQQGMAPQPGMPPQQGMAPQPGFGQPPQAGAPQPGFGQPPQAGAPQSGFGVPPQAGVGFGPPPQAGMGGPMGAPVELPLWKGYVLSATLFPFVGIIAGLFFYLTYAAGQDAMRGDVEAGQKKLKIVYAVAGGLWGLIVLAAIALQVMSLADLF